MAREDDIFQFNFCQKKVIGFNQIKEAHNIKAQCQQEWIMFFK